MQAELPTAKSPDDVVFVDALPYSDTGKLSRQLVASTVLAELGCGIASMMQTRQYLLSLSLKRYNRNSDGPGLRACAHGCLRHGGGGELDSVTPVADLEPVPESAEMSMLSLLRSSSGRGAG